MNICDKVLTKAPISWPDVHKQLLNAIQTRSSGASGLSGGGSNVGSNTSGAAGSSGLSTGVSNMSLASGPGGSSAGMTGAIITSSSSSIAVNKLLIKQCTDLLIKHIKNLNQAQVIDQLENLAQSSGLLVCKTPSEEEPTTVNAFLTTDDFFFEVSVNIRGEITDVKFTIFSEPAMSSCLLKDIFSSWNWDLLAKHIDGIKSNFILKDADRQIRARGFKSIQCLEKDLHTLYQIQLKYLDRISKTRNGSSTTQTSSTSGNSKQIDKLINHTPIGVLKKSELGEPMRLYYYLSPLDLIQHHQNHHHHHHSSNTASGGSLSDGGAKAHTANFDSTYKIINSLSIEDLFKYEIGSYVTISLYSTTGSSSGTDLTADVKSPPVVNHHKLADTSLLLLNENQDERVWHEYLNPYLNFNFNFERNPLFSSYKSNNSNNSHFKYNNGLNSDQQIPGCYLLKLNKPIVMCISTLNELQTRIGIETIPIDGLPQNKLTPFFELLAKTEIKNKVLSDAYSVQLPDENQVYYITELDQPNCMAIVVDRLFFAHPQDLLHILEILRKQLLFNELLLSCMKKICTNAITMQNNNHIGTTNYNYSSSSVNSSNVRIIEIGLFGPFIVSIIMQHPKLLCYTTIEIDLTRSNGNIETRFKDHNDLHNPNIISEIIRRCHSIPVTIRALLMKYRQSNSSLASRKRSNTNNNNNNGNPDSSHNNNNNNNNNNNGSNNQHETNNHHHQNNHSFSNGNYNSSMFNDHQMEDSSSVVKPDDNDDQDEEEDEGDFATNELHVTPRSLIAHDSNGTVYTTTMPNRLTPSRRDSYNRSNSTTGCAVAAASSSSSILVNGQPSTPTSLSSIYTFSNLINDQKQLQQQQLQQQQQQLNHHESTGEPTVKSEPILVENNTKLNENSQNNTPNSTTAIGKPASMLISTNRSENTTPADLTTSTPPVAQTKPQAVKAGSSSTSDAAKKQPVLKSQSSEVSINSPQLTTSAAAKKRKASTSSTSSTCDSLTSTPVSVASTSQPPSAKRKMTQSSSSASQNPEFKRHNSLVDPDSDTSSSKPTPTTGSTNKQSTPNSSAQAATNKKLKLKTSLSSADLSSTTSTPLTSKSSENAIKKPTPTTADSSTPSTLNKSQSIVKKDKESNVLTNNNKQQTTPKQTNESGKLSGGGGGGIKTPQSSGSKPVNKLPNSSTPAGKPNPSSQMKIKPITEDGLKIRISKEPNKSLNKSSLNNSTNSNNNSRANLSNLSATELQLKGVASPVTAGGLSTTPLSASGLEKALQSGLQQQTSSNRTPSPSPSSLSSFSISTALTTPSPDQSTTSNNNTDGEQSTSKSATSSTATTTKTVAKQRSNDSAAAALSAAKPNTPPLPAAAASFALSLGLGTSFKGSSFKIPHKSKSASNDNNDEDVSSTSNNKTNPISSSSPIGSKSPGKSSTSPQPDGQGQNRSSSTSTNSTTTSSSTNNNNNNNKQPSAPSAVIRSASTGSGSTNRNNSSPKWQPTYSAGNSSPRYVNNYESNNTSSNTSSSSSSSASNLSGSSSSSSSSNQSNKNSGQKSTTNTNGPTTGGVSSSSKSSSQMQRPSSSSSSSSSNRPLTPIPSGNRSGSSSSSTSSSSGGYFHAAKPAVQPLPPVPLMSTSTSSSTKPILPLMPLMSTFNSTPPPPSPCPPPPTAQLNSPTGVRSLMNTPLSPTNELLKDQTKPSSSSSSSSAAGSAPASSNTISVESNTTSGLVNSKKSTGSSSTTPQPPDSPVCETAPPVIPKLIPLERSHSGHQSATTPNEQLGFKPIQETPTTTSINRAKGLKPVDIASPDAPLADEEDDVDNLVIDLIQSTTANIKQQQQQQQQNNHVSDRVASISPPSGSVSSASIKSPSPPPANSTPTVVTTLPIPTSTFTTRQLSSNNEILSAASPSTHVPMSPRASTTATTTAGLPSTKSPCILEEDLNVNEAITS